MVHTCCLLVRLLPGHLQFLYFCNSQKDGNPNKECEPGGMYPSAAAAEYRTKGAKVGGWGGSKGFALCRILEGAGSLKVLAPDTLCS
jgi:hypothetical protein